MGGHLAAKCTEAPRCQLCASKNWATEHRLGGPACPSSPAYKKRKGKEKERKKLLSETKKLSGDESPVVSKPPGKQLKSKPKKAKSTPEPKTEIGTKDNRLALPPPEEKNRKEDSIMEEGLEKAMDIS